MAQILLTILKTGDPRLGTLTGWEGLHVRSWLTDVSRKRVGMKNLKDIAMTLTKGRHAASRACAYVLGLLCLGVLGAPVAHATDIPLGDAANYAVIYSGTTAHKLNITDIGIGGNVGVGATGQVYFTGNEIAGRLDFSAANSGQYHDTNAGTIGDPAPINYNVGQITTDLSSLSSLSSLLGNLSGIATLNLNTSDELIHASDGTLKSYTFNGNTQDYRVFQLGTYGKGDGDVLTIKGDGSGAPVVININKDINLKGGVILDGLTSDQVLWNIVGTNHDVNLDTHAGSEHRNSFDTSPEPRQSSELRL